MSCELCERPAGDAYLCPACELETAVRLERLPDLLDRLADLLVPTPRADGGRRGPSSGSRPPLDIDVVGRRYGFALLVTWHRAILPANGRRAARYGTLDEQVTGACIALRASMRWIARWPGAGDLAREVRELFEDTLTVVGGRDLPVRMGWCPQPVDGASCGAELLLPAGAQVVHCPWCGATYPPGVWAALRVAQRGVLTNARITPQV